MILSGIAFSSKSNNFESNRSNLTQVHTYNLEIDWKLINTLSKIDRFDASWTNIENRDSKSLKHLRSTALIKNVGASARLEGTELSDSEVAAIIQNLDISKPQFNENPEALGYYNTINIIFESYKELDITENNLKALHKILLKFSGIQERIKGHYKQLSNDIEAEFLTGIKPTIFKTTEPGLATETAMQSLITWFHADKQTHPLIKCALFCYDFVSIHPFQDGNGRMSRLLANLLLLKHGYKWIEYISFEHEIENRKSEYYNVLMQCQQNRPGENINPWVMFFLDCLSNLQDQLMSTLQLKGERQLSPRDKSIYIFIEHNPGAKSGIISRKSGIPLPTVKRILADMVAKNIIHKHGSGAGTNYSL